MLSTMVSAPDLSAHRAAELSDGFAPDVLTMVVWERFEYVYGEGGEQTLGLVLAPPKVLPRAALTRLGQATRNFSYSRKTIEGTDEGSWERGHRAHGLLLVAPNGESQVLIARDDPPRDFSVTWWPLDAPPLTPEQIAAWAEAMQCDELRHGGGPCALGPLAPLLEPERLRNIESEVPPLTLPFDDAPRAAATQFLEDIERSR